ncbi:translation initiation factor IF-2 N-terminal domain-containing protein [Saccharothrix sp. S26]|uniref:translation initiation factor IF-2 N-terminal domain-containing protein n=1 Tax=Saccharothrix sp. S26 TaxID=2907215 RepID=UPI001F44866A|nr:translation initiation factor IF-2 N-terminal domain-containing protein [Saccharothrix sp. S26]MCE6993602.1 translation initiation factor IF-2 N-terminal domain-containing protein [Saccharothrix sp. S26]
MSNTEKPAGPAGGGSATPGHPDLADLPAKLRVHALAKLLGASSKDVVAALADLGETVKGAQSSVSRDLALKVAESLLGWDDIVTGEVDEQTEEPVAVAREVAPLVPLFAPPSAVFLPPTPVVKDVPVSRDDDLDDNEDETDEHAAADDAGDEGEGRRRRRRGRRGRGRGKGVGEDNGEDEHGEEEAEVAEAESEAEAADEPSADEEGAGSRRRRRRRRRKTGAEEEAAPSEDDPPNTVVHVREPARDARDDKADSEAAQSEVRSVRGSTRLEAKRQRRRDGREAGRRRAPVLSEAEFLARREAVERTMVVRERGDRTQIGVLEDGVLVEHFVTSSGSGSLVGNVYLGRVQNVLPSMEAAFIDIGRGRNAVLYAGEVDWDAAGLEGKARKIEQALSTGDSVLVQVTKDPVGHKGARLTTQISLPGRFLVYVPGGGATGISRKLPDNERKRLKDILKRVVPEDAGVIIRTASEGIAEEELARDVTRLQAQWQVIKDKADTPKAQAPQLLYEEPDLLVKVVRDLFTEDFSALVVQGSDAWETIDGYVRHVAPDLQERLRKHVGNSDAFTEYRIDEQLLKALDRKVWLPSGGYLVIDRTEAMTVIDVNTGKFTGSGGNLEETVTRNNLEAAEEIVRQLRLRDIGGIIVIDFIDMVLESNRDLVLRRLTECLGRDRTRHQVAEVTSLGLVQMTRKRVGTGLLEAFSTTCEHCRGRGLVVTTEPMHAHGNGNGSGNGGGQQQQQQQQQGGGRKSRRAKHAEAPEPVAEQTVEPTEEPEAIAEQPTSEDPVAAVVEEEAAPETPKRDRRQRRRARREAGAVVKHGDEPAPAPAASTPVAPAEPVAAEPVADTAAEPAPVASPARTRRVTRAAGTAEPATTSPAAAVAEPAPVETGRIAPPVETAEPAPVKTGRIAPAAATVEPAAAPAAEPAPSTAPVKTGRITPVARTAEPTTEAEPTAAPTAQPVQPEPQPPAQVEPTRPARPEPSADQPLNGQPTPPVVTTRRRTARRAASRPAGPPLGAVKES